MAREPVLAAGGIVLRREPTPLIAVVRLRKRDEWVLPKGKLDDGETPLAAAKREVLEETGHEVTVHEFLGTLVYEISGRSKVVHYWRMEARGGQTHELMNDIRAVDWLPLEAALERLSRVSERAFLANVGPRALLSLSRRTRAKALAVRKRRDRNLVAPVPALPELPPAVASEAVEQIIVVAPAAEAMVSDLTAARVEVEPAPQTAAIEATIAAPCVESAPASVAGAADDRAQAAVDGRRLSLAQRVRDWLGLAA